MIKLWIMLKLFFGRCISAYYDYYADKPYVEELGDNEDEIV